MKFKIGITGNGEVPSVFYSKEGQELINKQGGSDGTMSVLLFRI